MNAEFLITRPDSTERLFSIGESNQALFSTLTRLPYFTVVCLQEGSVELKADLSIYHVSAPAVLFFSPFQPFLIKKNEENIPMKVLHFHPDFFCILKHQKEVSCNGVLFNNLFAPPFVELTPEQSTVLESVFKQMQDESSHEELAQNDLLLSYLKIFLIHTTRYKAQNQAQIEDQIAQNSNPDHSILQKYKTMIEEFFVKEHSPSIYADKLNVSLKTLGKLTKKYFDRTPSDLIQERLMMEAKRELYLTDKSVKEIAYSLGFEDEFYFSRLFKKNTDTSPINYRKSVGEDQAKIKQIAYS